MCCTMFIHHKYIFFFQYLFYRKVILYTNWHNLCSLLLFFILPLLYS